MEIKKWQDYSASEKRTVLYYWWNEYQRRWPVYQNDANEKFDRIVDMNVDLVYATIIMLWQCNILSSGQLVSIMEQGEGPLFQVLNKALEFRTPGEKLGYFERISDEFLEELVTDFNKKYPDRGDMGADTGFGSL